MALQKTQRISIDNFLIDVSINERHTLDTEVTEHPVETGADIADHVRARPIAVDIEGLVSDTPIGNLAVERVPGGSYADDALAFLTLVRDNREPITIVTSLQTYDNMVMDGLNITIDKDTGHALRFSASFKQIILVTNLRTTLRVATDAKCGTRKVDRGNLPVDFPQSIKDIANNLPSFSNAYSKMGARKGSFPTDANGNIITAGDLKLDNEQGERLFF